jgi:hypothetical protein
MAIASLPQGTFADRCAVAYEEIYSLALELCADAGYPLATALRIARDDLGLLTAYAERWDRHAFYAGNDDALPF